VPIIEFAPLDHQQIDVTIRPHLPPGRRAEHNDLLKRCGLDDTADNIRQDPRLYSSFFVRMS
jgi:hypothetical protein